jgi:Ras-related protein Rab-18
MQPADGRCRLVSVESDRLSTRRLALPTSLSCPVPSSSAARASPVYDITSRESFENIQHWLKEIDIYSTNDDCVKLLIGNKIDEAGSRTVSKKEGSAFARENNMLFIEASAKTQDGINQAFDEVIQKILDSPALLVNEQDGSTSKSSSSSTMRLDRDQRQPGGGSCGGFCA